MAHSRFEGSHHKAPGSAGGYLLFCPSAVAGILGLGCRPFKPPQDSILDRWRLSKQFPRLFPGQSAVRPVQTPDHAGYGSIVCGLENYKCEAE